MSRTASPSSSRRWAVVGLVLFVLIDAALVAWALSVDRGAATGTPVPAASPAAGPTATPTAEPAAVAPDRLIAALDGDTAWRASVGSCTGAPPAVELTTDGGRNWRVSDLAGLGDVAAVASVEITSADIAAAVAFDAQDCDPVLALTYVGGDDWVSYPDRVTGHWFVDPASPSMVRTPAGELPAPCSAVVSLAARNDSDAAVLCADHSVHRTADAGDSWSRAVPVAGAVAVAADDDGYVLARTGQSECAGVAVTFLPDGADSPQAGGACATSSLPEAGQVALDTGGGSTWLWAGDEVFTSRDGGDTWG